MTDIVRITLRSDEDGFHVETTNGEGDKTFWDRWQAGAYADWLSNETGWPIRPEANDG